MQIEIAHTEKDQVEQSVDALLTEHSQETGFPYAPQPLVLKITDGGDTLGGLVGSTNWEWLYITSLAVDKRLRGQGLGRKLMLEAERIAVERGCRGAWIDTFSFQAPQFYESLGYEPFGKLDDYPEGEQRVFLRKLFTA
ncbi:GNAT family N-acetyltransferase [Blastopirellula marina]|uniref:GNAT family N-acetyltransferase n=1 Tax=Blastopirellula marina TaxID=124 RepID=A0A2S8GL86_9BACT|nr:GNAT family N-acetyltransferase [Blastopirellula marina]PQO45202.1 GNAT family N-acetyltransferase [Blastopirellula marina]